MTQKSHWYHAVFIFFFTLLAGAVLLPLVRSRPETAHSNWINIAIVFFLCVLSVEIMFRLLSPRIKQLDYWKTYPPAWLAVLLAWLMIAAIDLGFGLERNGYRSTLWEWLGYGGCSLLIVGFYHGIWSEVYRWFHKVEPVGPTAPESVTLEDIERAPWQEIETWLKSDAPAQYDFLGNRAIAERIVKLISSDTRSVGIVGTFGAGKSSLVTWIIDQLERSELTVHRCFVCKHSCWGFETSATAIHDMLGSAVSKLSQEIDTFEVNSLPESYRQTFSAGGNWVDAISKLMLHHAMPEDQFSHLSDLLEHIGGRLVFIIEDLDRNETHGFEIQEVLAFLERLKDHQNLSFVLTGGLTSTRRIDYNKLCDHIEYLRSLQPFQSSGLIERVRLHCMDQSIFPHISLADTTRNYEFSPLTGMYMRLLQELPLPHALATLLNTPRSLRHALARTLSAWKCLYGEVAFDHLLAVNVLRFGAPECFHFLLRQWDLLCSSPTQNPLPGEGRNSRIRETITEDWNQTTKNAEWNSTAALKIMEYILPATEYWLVDKERSGHSKNGWQLVTEERYWLRAVNESIDVNDVRDQEVLGDTKNWISSPSVTSELVKKLASMSRYGEVWENIATSQIGDKRDLLLLLSEQVIQRILSIHGPKASMNSPGFLPTCRLVGKWVSTASENRKWVEDRIADAAPVSIEMINALWHLFSNPGQYSILLPDDMEPVRKYVLDILKDQLKDGASLSARLSLASSSTLFQMIFDTWNKGSRFIVNVKSWSWLGPILLDALRSRNIPAVVNCGVLLGARFSGEIKTLDTEVLDQFFGNDRNEVIDILAEMIDQLPESDKLLVRGVIRVASHYFANGTLPLERPTPRRN